MTQILLRVGLLHPEVLSLALFPNVMPRKKRILFTGPEDGGKLVATCCMVLTGELIHSYAFQQIRLARRA